MADTKLEKGRADRFQILLCCVPALVTSHRDSAGRSWYRWLLPGCGAGAEYDQSEGGRFAAGLPPEGWGSLTAWWGTPGAPFESLLRQRQGPSGFADRDSLSASEWLQTSWGDGNRKQLARADRPQDARSTHVPHTWRRVQQTEAIFCPSHPPRGFTRPHASPLAGSKGCTEGMCLAALHCEVAQMSKGELLFQARAEGGHQCQVSAENTALSPGGVCCPPWPWVAHPAAHVLREPLLHCSGRPVYNSLKTCS